MTGQYAVITNYTNPDGRTTVHAYGPYDEKKARQTNSQMIKETDVPDGGSLRIHTCKLINIDTL